MAGDKKNTPFFSIQQYMTGARTLPSLWFTHMCSKEFRLLFCHAKQNDVIRVKFAYAKMMNEKQCFSSQILLKQFF